MLIILAYTYSAILQLVAKCNASIDLK